MLNNKNFYPTPGHLLSKMFNKVTEFRKIKDRQKRFLDPQGGKGDIVEYAEKLYNDTYSNHRDVYTAAIEIDPILQATLRGKEIRVLDSDFLQYTGADQFDLIVANPPFDNADKHLHKMLDIMYRGEIVCLLNAETFRNPYSDSRKELIRRLVDLNADLDYLPDMFLDAERKTQVEVALVYVNIKRDLEDDLFDGASDRVREIKVEDQDEKNEISTKKHVEELVLQYKRTVTVCTETIMEFWRNKGEVGNYLTLTFGKGDDSERCSDLTAKVQHQINGVLEDIRRSYWRKVLDLKEVKTRLTEKKLKEFESQITTQCEMEFTLSNLQQFIINLIGSYEDILTATVVEVFEKMSCLHSFRETVEEKNIHYFNGWKTNDAFKVGKRVVIPVYASYGNPFLGYSGWQLDWQAGRTLHDIDLVMNYFDARSEFRSLDDAVRIAFELGTNKGESTYFKFICYKKGTIHLTFKDEDIRRRFNVTACRGKNWLPDNYGSKPFDNMPPDEKAVVEAFEENVKDYVSNQGQPVFAAKNLLQIEI